MRYLLICLVLCLGWLPLQGAAQSRSVAPGELSLTIEVIDQGHVPYAREMVMIVIRGVYRRHVTREQLVQPDLSGFNWTQLGPDDWHEERIRGQKVKVLQRRMALYPEQAGTLTIGAFRHQLTLTDEGDDWFEHEIASEPVTIEVAPAPPVPGWWFPVKRLEINDNWSNPPDRLAPGEGVLRIIRIKAVGVTPEMLPPMPELTSPSGMVFAHPDKRLVELSPEGPVSYAFWRWTIQPTNGRSAIVEPLRFGYFDTTTRTQQEVEISAQRVAYDETGLPPLPAPQPPVRLPGRPMLALGALVTGLGLWTALRGRQTGGTAPWRRIGPFDPLWRRLQQAARSGDAARTRQAARALMRRDGSTASQRALLSAFDSAVFARTTAPPDTRGFARAFLQARPPRAHPGTAMP